jgi:DNA-binding transcriptional LysR family regulator
MPTNAQLRAFLALATEGSFQAAADRLRLTQPAISIQIRNLEQDSARQLFRRKGQDLTLTEDGKRLLEKVQHLQTVEEEIAQFLAPTSDLPDHILLAADGPHVALDLVATCKALAPDVTIDIQLGNARSTWEQLVRLRADAVVMANPPDDPHVMSQILTRQNLQAWVPRGHPLAKTTALTLAQIAAHAVVFREDGSNTQRIVDRAFAEAGHRPHIALRIGSREGVREAVTRGLGIGFGFDRETQSDPTFHAIPVVGQSQSNIDMLLYLKSAKDSPAARLLAKAAKTLTLPVP